MLYYIDEEEVARVVFESGLYKAVSAAKQTEAAEAFEDVLAGIVSGETFEWDGVEYAAISDNGGGVEDEICKVHGAREDREICEREGGHYIYNEPRQDHGIQASDSEQKRVYRGADPKRIYSEEKSFIEF